MALLLSVLSAGCGVLDSQIDSDKASLIDARFAARDSCLRVQAAKLDPDVLASAAGAAQLAQNCTTETEKLVAAFGMHGDSQVADAVRGDSVARALRFLLEYRDCRDQSARREPAYDRRRARYCTASFGTAKPPASR